MASRADNGGKRGRIPWRIIGWGTAAFLLVLPLVAGAPGTLFRREVPASVSDGAGLQRGGRVPRRGQRRFNVKP